MMEMENQELMIKNEDEDGGSRQKGQGWGIPDRRLRMKDEG